MSDDRIVSLTDRRPAPARRLAATLVFANDQLRMPMEHGATGPVWTTIDPVEVSIEGREAPVRVQPRFGMIDHSPDGTSGELFDSGASMAVDLYFERDLFMAFQGAALSATPLTLFVTFGVHDGAPPSLMLAIERRTA